MTITANTPRTISAPIGRTHAVTSAAVLEAINDAGGVLDQGPGLYVALGETDYGLLVSGFMSHSMTIWPARRLPNGYIDKLGANGPLGCVLDRRCEAKYRATPFVDDAGENGRENLRALRRGIMRALRFKDMTDEEYQDYCDRNRYPAIL